MSIVGSVGYFSDIIMLPLHGYMSDRYVAHPHLRNAYLNYNCSIHPHRFGRRTMIASALFFVCTLGIAKSFATSYIMFVLFEFLLCLCTPGSFTTLFIMMIEWVVPEKRVIGGTFICIAYSVGQILLGVVSASMWSFRSLLRTIYAPAYLVLAYMWLVPESVRWLNSKGHNGRVRRTIEQAAAVNNIRLSERAMVFLNRNDAGAVGDGELGAPATEMTVGEDGAKQPVDAEQPVVGRQTIFTSRRLFVRLLICVFCMFSNSAIYIGLNVHSVSLSGSSKHFNYIAVNVIEVPANIVSYFIMMRMGRRLPFACSLMATAVLCLMAEHVPVFEYEHALRLALFVASKLCITISYSIVFVYISEMFPTCLRQSFMNSCYAMSCMGSMTAPQIALLNIYAPSLPMFLFAGVATVASGMVMLLPETFNNPLPDTIAEAEAIGRVNEQQQRKEKKVTDS